jgi:hypothetical protein
MIGTPRAGVYLDPPLCSGASKVWQRQPLRGVGDNVRGDKGEGVDPRPSGKTRSNRVEFSRQPIENVARQRRPRILISYAEKIDCGAVLVSNRKKFKTPYPLAKGHPLPPFRQRPLPRDPGARRRRGMGFDGAAYRRWSLRATPMA